MYDSFRVLIILIGVTKPCKKDLNNKLIVQGEQKSVGFSVLGSSFLFLFPCLRRSLCMLQTQRFAT